MPAEALENQCLDALETELAKIGTAPTSNWLTTTPPQIEVGVPGENVPGPNLMSLWLHYLTGERGTDNAGIADHRRKCTFAVWCCSSHAEDGHRRMLRLLQDTRQCLNAAKTTFYELFSYGITIEDDEFYAKDSALRQGIWAVAIKVTVEFNVEDGADVVSLDSQLERTLLRIYPFAALPPVERVSAGIAARLEPPSVVIESSVGGANKLCELRVEGNVTDQWFNSPASVAWPQFKAEIAAQIGPYIGANASNTMFAGIELGTYNQLPPFPAAAANAVAQLRWNYGLARWELVAGVGDGVTPDTIVPLVGVPALVAGGGARARLLYDPFKQTLAGIVNGKTGAEITDPSLLPQFAAYSAAALTSGIFVTTGTSLAASVQALFSVCHCKLYDTTSPGATLWY